MVISTNPPQKNDFFDKVADTEPMCHEILRHHDFLFTPSVKQNTYIQTDKPGEWLCHLMDGKEMVIAGGGIVRNEKDELLLIHRKGKWDLPKGKIELKESVIEGAVREVQEETGVKIASAGKQPITTYHAYTLNGVKCIKETAWFHMEAYHGQTITKAQTEEGIDQVLWVSKADLPQYMSNTYPLIADLLQSVLTQ